jgi:acetyl esterase/lipase
VPQLDEWGLRVYVEAPMGINVDLDFVPLEMMDPSRFKRKRLDVPYASQSPAQKLDIYLPDEGKGLFPVIVAIHGGAWALGNKRDMQLVSMLEGLKRGYAVVSVGYRLSDEAKFPAQIHDCKAAIRYLRANGAEYHMDGERIGVWGPSAGGHLSALVGTSAGVKELEDLSMGNASVSSSVLAVVDWCGPTESLLSMNEQLIESGIGVPNHSEEDSPGSILLGQKITEVPELVRFASPMSYVTPDIPYFLIQHGSEDPIVPVQQSELFAAEIERVAGADKVILEVLEGAGHCGDPAFETEDNIQRVLDFLDAHLK